MRGRSLARVLVPRLLVVALVVIVPILVRGQAGVVSRDSAKDAVSPPSGMQLRVDRDFLPPLLPRLRPAPPGAIGLPLITRAAGIIFSGTVSSVSRAPEVSGRATPTLAITFRVEQGIRGAASGQDLTVFQWIGLWNTGQRYRAGDHVLLFLYPPSKLGLTSCVGGSTGRFAVDGLGNVLLTAEHQAAFKADPLLSGKTHVSVHDFQRAVQLARGEP